MQVELLRILETKTFTRVGGNREIRSDFRIICATNRDLKEMVDKGEFREDLYYRLNVFDINIPPLRERTDDIEPLAHYFIEKYAQQMNRPTSKIGRGAMNALNQYTFPGNVRELENMIERAIVVGEGDTIRAKNLPLRIDSTAPGVESIQDLEKIHILKILEKYHWNVSRTARALEIDRVTLYNKMKKYAIQKPGA